MTSCCKQYRKYISFFASCCNLKEFLVLDQEDGWFLGRRKNEKAKIKKQTQE